MNSLKNHQAFENLTAKDIRRYALQISSSEVGTEGQLKIKNAKVLVVGAGGKGSSVLQNLATSGIGLIGICDNSMVQDDLIIKQNLYGNSDLGKQKAIISKQKLYEINNLVHYELHNVFLSEKNIDSICEHYDILVDTTDHFPSHYLINDAATRNGKIVVFGSSFSNYGIVSVFNYNGGPAFRWLFPDEPLIKDRSETNGYVCQSSLSGILGAIIANETIKVILNLESKLNGHLLKFNAVDYSISFESITRNPDNFIDS